VSTPSGQSFKTVELRITFSGRLDDKLTAEAIVIQRGKTTGYVECTVRDESVKLVAKAASSAWSCGTRGTGVKFPYC